MPASSQDQSCLKNVKAQFAHKTSTVDHTVIGENRVIVEEVLFPGSSYSVLVMDLTFSRTFFSFSSLAMSEEDIKEYAFLGDSEDFSVCFLPIEVWIPKWTYHIKYRTFVRF